MHWYSLIVDGYGDWKWQTDLTHSYFGDTKLFQHDFKWIEINVGYNGMGIQKDDFQQIKEILMQKYDSLYCDDNRCLGKK